MALSKTTIEEIDKRIATGHTYSRISKDLELDWWDVRNAAKRSWRSAKVRVTNRLKKLAAENDTEKRKVLIAEIDGDVNYLYAGGKALGQTIDSIEKVING